MSTDESNLNHGENLEAESSLAPSNSEVAEAQESEVNPVEDGRDIPETMESNDPPAEEPAETPESDVATPKKAKKRRKRRKPKRDAKEQRLLGRRAMCKRIADIAPEMFKQKKLRVLGRYLESMNESTKGMDDDALTERIIKDARKIANKKRVLANLEAIDPDVNRRNLKKIIIFGILLEEETHSLEENRLAEKIVEYEKELVAQAKTLDFFDEQKHDQKRWHHYDTYRIVLEAAWKNKDDVSLDEARLLRVLRAHLNISREEHWLIGAHIKRFPKQKRALHTRDEIDDARKELQREAILWNYTDENNQRIDVIPYEIAQILREEEAGLELQRTNYRRILQHDSIRLTDLRDILKSRDMDRHGNKAELIERIVSSDIKPSGVLEELDRGKLSDMCRLVGLKSSGNKPDFINRLIEFYDDLSFEEPGTDDEREEWYNNYEFLATRAYADLKAKKLISKDLDIEHQFEEATDFLFETKLHVQIDTKRRVTKADGRILLPDRHVILWDCKSVENAVNLQDHLEDQFDSYLRKEREKGTIPIGFFVIGPAFTKQSLNLAYKYKARTNWDVALIRADALKHLAEHWNAAEPDKPFPIRLLNQTEVIDKERAEFLLSLA